MIAIGDPRKTPPALDSQRDREARHRAAYVAQEFGGRNSSGPMLDFSKASAPAAKLSGTGSLLDLYGDAPAESRKAEIARRMDVLSPEVAALPQKHARLSIDHLEALNVLQRQARSGAPVPVIRGDIARAIKASPERAETIIADLASCGLIQRHATAGTVPYFTVRL